MALPSVKDEVRVQVRILIAQDCHDVLQLYLDSLRQLVDDLPTPEQPHVSCFMAQRGIDATAENGDFGPNGKNLLKRWVREDRCMFVAETDGQIVGCCAVCRGSNCNEIANVDCTSYSIWRLAVDRRLRQSNVKAKLMKVVDSWARAAGGKEITIFTGSPIDSRFYIAQMGYLKDSGSNLHRKFFVTVRRLAHRDCKDVARIWAEGLQQTVDADPSFAEPMHRLAVNALAPGGSVGPNGSNLMANWSGEDRCMFVADLRGQVVGCCGVKRGSTSHEVEPLTSSQYSVWRVSVDKKVRCCGVGRSLMRAAEAWAQTAGGTEMHLVTGNLIARRFYQCLGYSCMDEESAWLRKPLDINGSCSPLLHGVKALVPSCRYPVAQELQVTPELLTGQTS